MSPGFAHIKGADQPAHPRSLVSAFAIRLFESIISKLATSECSIFQLVSVAEETGLSLSLSETPRVDAQMSQCMPKQQFDFTFIEDSNQTRRMSSLV